MKYKTYRKRGKGWEYLGERSASNGRSAALQASYVYNLCIVGYRLTGSNCALEILKLSTPANVHHG